MFLKRNAFPVLDAALKAAGVEHETQIVPKLGHNPIKVETMEKVREWLVIKLKKAD
jgi:predicted esterase